MTIFKTQQALENKYLVKLIHDIQPHKQAIVNHELYNKITNLNNLKTFMQTHVFAVWDFMSLLKTLQRQLTCTDVPWTPKGTPETRYLINEIVIGEESDIDQFGNRLSHFEMYLNAMKLCGCDISIIENFITQINSNISVDEALNTCKANEGIKSFVSTTFEFINTNKPHISAAVFTFGREDLIPEMFLQIVKKLNKTEATSSLEYYLERHIEVDGGHHGQLALQMISSLCGNDENKWNEATESAIKSLIARKKMWDSISSQIN